MSPVRSQLKDSVLEGGVAFDRAHGAHAFEYPGLDPRFNQVFNAAMYNQTNLVIGNMLETYNGFNDLKQLVDTGGGLGHTIKAITSKYPQIKGINFDLPHVIEHAPAYPGMFCSSDLLTCDSFIYSSPHMIKIWNLRYHNLKHGKTRIYFTHKNVSVNPKEKKSAKHRRLYRTRN